MIQELVYTSAPEGLKPGVRGFCTVLCTQGMPKNLMEFLESHSGYRHLDTAPHPENFSHVTARIGGRRYHVLSRIADCGSDYTGRTNKLAHHLALTPDELPSGGPAWVLSEKTWRKQWNESPHWSDQVLLLPTGEGSVGICHAWGQLTDDPGWAGVLAESAAKGGRPMSVIFRPGNDNLTLVAEAVSLLPPERYWDATFSTYFTGQGAGVECHWRFLLDGTREADIARRNTHAPLIDLIDLERTHKRAPTTDWTQAARKGSVAQPSVPQPPPASTSPPTPKPGTKLASDEDDWIEETLWEERRERVAEAPTGRNVPTLPPHSPPGAPPRFSHRRPTARQQRGRKLNWQGVALAIAIPVIAFLLYTSFIRQSPVNGVPKQDTTIALNSSIDRSNEPPNAEQTVAMRESGADDEQRTNTARNSSDNMPTPESRARASDENLAHTDAAQGQDDDTTTTQSSNGQIHKTNETGQAQPSVASRDDAQDPADASSQESQNSNGRRHIVNDTPKNDAPQSAPLPELSITDFQPIVALSKSNSAATQLALVSLETPDESGDKEKEFELKPAQETDADRPSWNVVTNRDGIEFPIGTFQLQGQDLSFKWERELPKWAHPNRLRYHLLGVQTGTEEKTQFVLSEPKSVPHATLDFENPVPYRIPFDCSGLNPDSLRINVIFEDIPEKLTLKPSVLKDIPPEHWAKVKVDPHEESAFARTDFQLRVTWSYKENKNSEVGSGCNLEFEVHPYGRDWNESKCQFDREARIQTESWHLKLIQQKTDIAEGRLRTLENMLADAPEDKLKLQSDLSAAQKNLAELQRRQKTLMKRGANLREDVIPAAIDRIERIKEQIEGHGAAVKRVKDAIEEWQSAKERLDIMSKILREELSQIRVGYSMYVEVGNHRVDLVQSESSARAKESSE